jgi:hypothetical protein
MKRLVVARLEVHIVADNFPTLLWAVFTRAISWFSIPWTAFVNQSAHEPGLWTYAC